MYFTAACLRTAAALRPLTLTAVVVLVAFAADARAATDISPPAAPLGVRVQQGEAWQPISSFDIEWDNPTDQSSIEVAHYELCPAVPLGPCTVHQEASSGISAVAVTVPYAGWFWFRVWLEDAAGNVDPDLKSEAAMLRFDNQLPPLASVHHAEGWLNAAAPTRPTLVAQISQGAYPTLSGSVGTH